MTHLVRVSQGEANGYGKQAVDSCVAFKRQLQSVLTPMEGAWLVTIGENGKRGVAVVYNADVTGSEQWAQEAAGLSPGIWDSPRERRMCRVR